MSDIDDRGGEPLAARVATRLSQNRRTLAAAAVIIVVVDLASGGRGFLAFCGVVALIAVAAFAPRARSRREADEIADSGPAIIDDLPAIDLAAAVPDPLYVFDREGTILFANGAAITAFGPSDPGLSLQLKFRAPEMHELVRNVLGEGVGPQMIDFAERVPVERAYRVSATAIGKDTGLYVLLFKDQSEVRRIDRMRADFIANASHELRTPLASIAGFIETLRGPARDDPKAKDNFLQIMQNQTSRMARLIDDLLSLSRLEMKPYLKPGEKVDLCRIVQGVIDSMAHLADETGVVIEANMPEGPVEVAGNRDELVQVFENLLENACKYGGSGERVIVTVERADEGSQKEAVVTVRDFGPGIPEEHIPRVTERFYRVDVETSRVQRGTGLGLSIVKHILTRHDARLTIRSQTGEGASFAVHLPVE